MLICYHLIVLLQLLLSPQVVSIPLQVILGGEKQASSIARCQETIILLVHVICLEQVSVMLLIFETTANDHDATCVHCHVCRVILIHIYLANQK